MALVASALVRLPILSVLRLALQNSKTRAYTLKQFGRLAPRTRSAAVRQNARPLGRGGFTKHAKENHFVAMSNDCL